MSITVAWWSWVIWFVTWMLGFAFLEGIALATHQLTLSRFVYNMSTAWPPLIWLMGVVAGGLAVHFWWHWAPPGSIQGG